MVDKKTIAFYDQASFDYAEKFAASTPDAQLRAFMAMLPERGHVLDLGCGPAFASAHMRTAGFSVDPVDASKGMIKTANALHDINARLLRFDELNAVAAYDGVWANFSLLHAPRADLPAHLAAIATALRPKGAFHVGLKCGTGTARDQIARLYTYVTEDELLDLLTTAGFADFAIDHGEGAGMAGTVDPWIVIRARKT